MKARVQGTVGAIAMMLTAAAVLAGGAQADRPDNRGGMLGVGSINAQTAVPDVFERAVGRQLNELTVGVGGTTSQTAVADVFERAVLRQLDGSAVPDAFERAVLRESGVAMRPEDRAGTRGPGVLPLTSPAPSTAAGSDGFAWSEAAVGAGFTLGLVLLGGAAAVVIRQRRGAILH
jgi:hypothetical protein